MNRPLELLILSDGKKGHENQSVGLAEALARRADVTFQVLRISERLPEDRKPDAIIAAGHNTHWSLLMMARRFKVPSILIMKPSLIPGAFFTRCLIPGHDLRWERWSLTGPTATSIPQPRKNIIPTIGNLTRIPEKIPAKKDEGIIMLGGPSKHFIWETGPLVEAIRRIVTSRPDLAWTLGDSRRTPSATLDAIRELNLPLAIVPHRQSGPDWLRDTFLAAREAWLSPDSSSMLSEALTAGCHLGTLPLPAKGTRLSRAHDQMAADGWLTPFTNEISSSPLPAPPRQLNETARCAEILLKTVLNPSQIHS